MSRHSRDDILKNKLLYLYKSFLLRGERVEGEREMGRRVLLM